MEEMEDTRLRLPIYENGIHTISWLVEDSAGNKEGIGSRHFQIQD
jgi:hypothetical protein